MDLQPGTQTVGPIVPPGGWDQERVTLGRHFLRDMEVLWGDVLRMAAVVETALNDAVRALCEGRVELADSVDIGERAINSWEVQIEQLCLRVLALHQPVASDLRRVAVALKINGDLERMGDLAQHIANRAGKLARSGDSGLVPPELESMAIDVLQQVRDALDALVNSDAELARVVIAGDTRIDRLRQAVSRDLKDCIRREPDRVDAWLRLINVARNFERVADHATNIAEAVVYLKEGSIIRHIDRRGEVN